jgi:hypothetical protein
MAACTLNQCAAPVQSSSRMNCTTISLQDYIQLPKWMIRYSVGLILCLGAKHGLTYEVAWGRDAQCQGLIDIRDVSEETLRVLVGARG